MEKDVRRLNVNIPTYLYDMVSKHASLSCSTKSFILSSILMEYYGYSPRSAVSGSDNTSGRCQEKKEDFVKP